MKWRWIYAPPSHGECGQIKLMRRKGEVAATVFLNLDSRGYNWFVWGTNGTGGENSQEPTVDAAVVAAQQAARRWGQFDKLPEVQS